MNKPITMKKFFALFLMLSLIPLFGSCDMEDSIEAIFLGKTFKMTGIFLDKKTNDPVRPCSSSLNWEECTQHLTEITKEESNFNIRFTSEQFSGTVMGSTIEGTWKADGKSKEITINITSRNGDETDDMANAYLQGLTNAYKYTGDAANYLQIHFKDNGGVKKYILYDIKK